jgi:hypothetical protein
VVCWLRPCHWRSGLQRVAVGGRSVTVRSIGNRADVQEAALHRLKDTLRRRAKDDVLHRYRCIAPFRIDLRSRRRGGGAVRDEGRGGSQNEWQVQRRYMQIEGLQQLTDNQRARLSAVISRARKPQPSNCIDGGDRPPKGKKVQRWPEWATVQTRRSPWPILMRGNHSQTRPNCDSSARRNRDPFNPALVPTSAARRSDIGVHADSCLSLHRLPSHENQ